MYKATVHPRQRGENVSVSSIDALKHGTPPPARGKQRRRNTLGNWGRYTPASAGKTPVPNHRPLRCTVYPRQRGENGTINRAK